MAKTEHTHAELPDPFERVALAFSGGGFRAAAFSLGTLSYLEHLNVDGVPVTKKIRMISSASGGTITNLLYSAAIHRGEPFAQFFDHTREKLRGDGLLEKVLTVLNDDTQWNRSGDNKQRNLINAFAKVYDEDLFDHETLEVFAEKKYVKQFEICCNTTEFYRGLSFRFQTNGTKSHDQIIGNRYLHFDNKQLGVIRHIKLADVLAASSCFPLGFEPILFPEDFSHSGLDAETLRSVTCYENYNEETHRMSDSPDLVPDPKQPVAIHSFGLMDGGITDNQGLYSLMLADKRRRRKSKPNPFDLMIITDVSSYFMDEYEQPTLETKGSWRARSVNYFIGLFQKIIRWPRRIQWLALIAATVLIAAGIIWCDPWIRIPGLILGGAALAVMALASLLRQFPATRAILGQPDQFDVVRLIRRNLPLKSFSDKIVNKLLDYFGSTPINVLEQMLRARLRSVASMVLDVNLKQIRRLIYEMFYNEKNWDHRRVPNFIYELSSFNAQARRNRLRDTKRLRWHATKEDLDLLDGGLDQLWPIAERARLMGTTLWFDEAVQARLADIIRTGQFTTCMNLLEYVISLERQGVVFPTSQAERLAILKRQLINDLRAFKINPNYLYDQNDPRA
jgi:predicted acylesterase/phospholipase RssA